MNRVNCLQDFAALLRQQIASSRIAEQRSPASDFFRKLFNELALALFRLQFTQNPAYRNLCQSKQISPGEITQWTRIPAVPTAAFKEWELTCIAEDERTAVFHSSGTTEQRKSRHFHHQVSLELYETSLLVWFAHNVLQRPVPTGTAGQEWPTNPFAATVLALTPPASQAPHSSLVHMFETLQRGLCLGQFYFTGFTGTDGAWNIDYDQTIAHLEQSIRCHQPVLLLGTAFSYVHLLDHLAERGLKLELPTGSQVLETGGYKGRSRALPKRELHRLITHGLGVAPSQIVCEYGMSELSSQAYSRLLLPHAAANKERSEAGPVPLEPAAFHFPPWTRIQIVSPESGREVQDGQTGLIRVFDLANVYSVMAIQTEDLAVRKGQGFEVIGRAELAEPRGCSLMATSVAD